MPCILRTVHTSSHYSGAKKAVVCARSLPLPLVGRDTLGTDSPTGDVPILTPRNLPGSNTPAIAIVLSLIVVGAVIAAAVIWSCVRRAHAHAYKKSGRQAHDVRRRPEESSRSQNPRSQNRSGRFPVQPAESSASGAANSVHEMPDYPPPAYQSRSRSTREAGLSQGSRSRVDAHVKDGRSTLRSKDVENSGRRAPSAMDQFRSHAASGKSATSSLRGTTRHEADANNARSTAGSKKSENSHGGAPSAPAQSRSREGSSKSGASAHPSRNRLGAIPEDGSSNRMEKQSRSGAPTASEYFDGR